MVKCIFKALRAQTLEKLTEQLNAISGELQHVHYVHFDDKTRVWDALVEVHVDVQ